jgi:hypothetical protein
MRFSRLSAAPVPWQQPRAQKPRNPNLPDRAAQTEMEVFDALPPAARAAFREARQQFSASDLRGQIVQGGCPKAIAEALKAEGKLPWQVGGTDGILALTVLALDDKYTAQFEQDKAE